jgi:hypothetical protein
MNPLLAIALGLGWAVFFFIENSFMGDFLVEAELFCGKCLAK